MQNNLLTYILTYQQVKTYVARVNVNKNYLLIQVVPGSVQVLFVKEENTTGCQTSE
jgi:hypothetical protein